MRWGNSLIFLLLESVCKSRLEVAQEKPRNLRMTLDTGKVCRVRPKMSASWIKVVGLELKATAFTMGYKSSSYNSKDLAHASCDKCQKQQACHFCPSLVPIAAVDSAVGQAD